MSKGRILIVDDEIILASSLKNILCKAGYNAAPCTAGGDFFPTLRQFRPDLILLDIYLGDVDGIQLLRQMKEEGWEVPTIVMTAHADVSLAVEAMKEGANDFLVKPFELSRLELLIEKVLEHARLRTKVKLLQEELEEQRSSSGIIGRSEALHRILTAAERLALGENTTVLIEGESGTGKELLARFIHRKSPRSDRAFVALNCGAIPKELAESEFFGYEKGAFTGATEKMRQGKFELADGGTIFLDEISELSLDMQVKLLRVLEQKQFYRLGGTREIGVDVRIIAASNRILGHEVEAGRFRQDLFYRLNVASVVVPALRDRREDIAPLTHAFLKEFCSKFNKPVPVVPPETMQYLESLPWKGNVRELRNAIERVILLNNTPTLTRDHFTFLCTGTNGHSGQRSANGKQFVLEIPPNGIQMKEVLRELILKTLTITNGNQVQAAKILGVTRSKLRYRMELLGIHPEQRSYRVENKYPNEL